MGKNFIGVQINHSPTITERAGADIADCRNRILKYDSSGAVVLAAAGTDIPIGIGIIEAGCSDVTGAEAGKAYQGDDVDIQIKDIGFVIAGAAIQKGQELTAGAQGLAVTAAAGNYVIGIALSAANTNEYCKIQIVHYQKADGTGAAG